MYVIDCNNVYKDLSCCLVMNRTIPKNVFDDLMDLIDVDSRPFKYTVSIQRFPVCGVISNDDAMVSKRVEIWQGCDANFVKALYGVNDRGAFSEPKAVSVDDVEGLVLLDEVEIGNVNIRTSTRGNVTFEGHFPRIVDFLEENGVSYVVERFQDKTRIPLHAQ